MSKKANLVLVRPRPGKPGLNHLGDIETAKEFAKTPPCWVVLVGMARKCGDEDRRRHCDSRLQRARQALEVQGISDKGVHTFFPEEVEGADDDFSLAEKLANFLLGFGSRSSIRELGQLDVRLPSDTRPPLLAAIVESLSVYPTIDVWLGDKCLNQSLRWERRRAKLRALTPAPVTGDADPIVGTSAPIEALRRKIERLADEAYPVLIIGETGSGKDLVARRLHTRSSRKGKFQQCNAARLGTLADSELFGHEKGAFTNADRARSGKIREASDGTFFLDEAFNLHPAIQAKLLVALNDVDQGIIKVTPVGFSGSPKEVSARLVVSSLSDPRSDSALPGTSSMRHDLYYRVAVGVIQVPPLREILSDLPAICETLLQRAGLERLRVSDDGLDALRGYHWPGNVRELRLMLIRAYLEAPRECTELGGDQLRAVLPTAGSSEVRALPLPCDLDRELTRIKAATLREALERTGGHQSKAGGLVGMNKNPRNFGRTLRDAEEKLKLKIKEREEANAD